MRAQTPAQIKEQLDVIEAILIDIRDSLSAWCSNCRTDQIRLRQLRNGYLPRHYFSDAAWEILIDLDQAERQSRLLAVSDLGLDSGIPLSTTLRYVQRMEADGYLVRTADPADGRRTNVALSETGRVAMNAIFDELAFEANSSQKENTGCMVALGIKAA